MIKFVSDLQQVGGFRMALPFPPSMKLTVMTWLNYCLKWRLTHIILNSLCHMVPLTAFIEFRVIDIFAILLVLFF